MCLRSLALLKKKYSLFWKGFQEFVFIENVYSNFSVVNLIGARGITSTFPLFLEKNSLSAKLYVQFPAIHTHCQPLDTNQVAIELLSPNLPIAHTTVWEFH